MVSQIKATDKLPEIWEKKKREEELMRDVLLMINNLSIREEASVKVIIDCLYDIGSINLINQRFRSRTLKGALKLITRISKPAFKAIAWRWFKSNCPKLITDWLYTQVAFKPEDLIPPPSEKEVISQNLPGQSIPGQNLPGQNLPGQSLPVSINSGSDLNVPHIEYQNQEVTNLRSQVKLLTGALIGTIAIFGGGLFWLGYSFERSQLQTVQQLQTQVKVLEASLEKPPTPEQRN